MTTRAKAEANRKNSKRSTGPKTANGKAVTRMNATTHGLRSLSPVLPDERAEDWIEYRTGIVAALSPVGALETELAERVALHLWRLRRVGRYETAVTTDGINGAIARARGEPDDDTLPAVFSPARHTPRTFASIQKELEAARANEASFAEMRDRFYRLPDLPNAHRVEGGDALRLLQEIGAYTPNEDGGYTDIKDHGFLTAVGVPEKWRDEPELWDQWTAETVRAGVQLIAEANELTVAELMLRAVRGADRAAIEERQNVVRLEAELPSLPEVRADTETAARNRSLLPPAEVAEKVMRYQSHLSKQLSQTLHMWERLRAIRDGNPPAPPAALDVTIEAGALPPAPTD